MKIKTLNIAILFGLLCVGISPNTIALQAKSVADCEKSFDSPNALSQCFDIVKVSIDRELQTWINNQTFVLEEFALVTGRYSALNMFKRSQRNFISYRENNCRWQYLHISPSKMAASAFKKCYILTTRDRITELSRLN